MSDFYPSKDYTFPSASNYDTNNTMSNTEAVAMASNNKATTNPYTQTNSEKAWAMRCDGQSGGGYTLTFNSAGLGGGNSTRMRYTKSCSPVIGATMSGGDCGCGAQPVLLQNQTGGTLKAVQTLANMISPLGINELASLVVLLFVNHYTNKSKSSKKQKGGNFNQYVGMLTPLGKDNLAVLASLLLLNYFSAKRASKGTKTQKGGADVLSFIDELLAPLGVNTFGSAWLLVILNEIFTSYKKQKGGSQKTFQSNNKLHKGGNELMKLIAPMGSSAFASTAVLMALDKYLNKTSKKQKGGELFNLLNSYKLSNLNNISMKATGGATKKSTPKKAMKKTTPKKAMKKTPKKAMKKTTPKKAMKKTTPKKAMKKTTPKKAMKTTPKKAMKKTPKKAMKKTPKKKSASKGLLAMFGL